MDSVSRPEFAKIFDRVSSDIDLEGATSAAAINNRMKVEIHKAKTNVTEERNRAKESKIKVAIDYHSAYSAYSAYAAEELDKLIAHDFAGRTIFEANLNPKGMVSQTLLYGRVEARKRVLAQKRAEVRAKLGFNRRDFF
jgi:hypothetical protein